jgi:hypothetical protein
MQTDVNMKLLPINPQFAFIVIQSQSLHILYLDSESSGFVVFKVKEPTHDVSMALMIPTCGRVK